MSEEKPTRARTVQIISDLWRDGHTPEEIAQETGHRIGVIRAIIQRESETGRLTRQRTVTVPMPNHIRKRIAHRARRAGQTIDSYIRALLLDALSDSERGVQNDNPR